MVAASAALLNDQSLTFRDLILRVARDAGMQTNTRAAEDGIPTDPAYLQRVKDAINDAREWIATAVDPSTGAVYPWQCLLETVTLSVPSTGAGNVDSDPTRIPLDSSHLVLERSRWVWRTTTGNYGGRFEFVHPDIVERLHASEAQTQGHPRIAYVANATYANDQAGSGPVRYIRIWPRPDQDYQLVGRAHRAFHPMVSLDEREPMGAAHRQAIIAGGMYMMRRSDPDLKQRDWYKTQFNEAIAKSIMFDKRSAPAMLDDTTDGGNDTVSVPVTVPYYGSIPLT